MASVWEVHDELLDRTVAIKVLAHHLNEDERARRRFQREARAAAGMSSHPHVVTIYDVGEYEDRSFIVMELMCCGSVADRMKQGRVPRETALSWLGDAASALDAAHEAGIVHRDIKPANLLLDERDRLGIADFGIARVAYDEQVTQTGQVLGTASYLAPEQALGEPATAASDRYALAVVAFELLTGRKPYPHEHFAAQARAHIEDPVPDAHEIDPSLPSAAADVLRRGMAKEPAERWPSAAAFVEALSAAVDGAPPSGPTEVTRPLGAPPPPAPRNKWPVVAALVALLFAAIGLAAVLSGGDENPSSDEPTREQAANKPAKKKKARAERTPTATPTPTATQTPQQTGPDEGRAAQLNAQGFQLLNAGSYQEAVGPLQQAYEACQGSEALDPCGYALFNYGRALRLAGNPDAAVPVLEERLQRFPDDQRETVEQELALAREGVTEDGGGSSTPGKGKGKGKKKGHFKGDD
jgi:serine/threonine-protein kinase